MKIAITGEKGFIAQNLISEIKKSNHEFVSIDDNFIGMKKRETGEVCVHQNNENDWVEILRQLKVDAIVHNAATVGTDVVALNPIDSIQTNILGTQNITNAANKLNILNVYIGTTVIYDTYKYQDSLIRENSDVYPRTNYAIQKYAGEMIVRNNAKEWLVMRPLFAYGGSGDPNSLIAKTFYSHKKNIQIPMFLDPEKKKDYMYVTDFCHAILRAIDSNIRNEDFNVSVEDAKTTKDIVELMSKTCDFDLEKIIDWKTNTDYLGNHLLSCNKFNAMIGFNKPKIDLELGIMKVWSNILNDKSDYNPLKFLDEAADKNIDLISFFPKK